MLLAVDWTPVAHVLHREGHCLGEGGDLVGVLKDVRYLLQVEDEAVHPDGTGENILVVLQPVFMTVVHVCAQGLEGIGLGHAILEDDPSEYLLPLILRVGAFIHQIIVLVLIKQPNEIGIQNHLEYVLAIHRNHVLDALHFHLL